MTPSPISHPRVIVAVDGSPSSLEALRQGRLQARLLGTTVLAVCAWHQQNGLFPPMSYHPEEDSREILHNSIREAFHPDVVTDVDAVPVNGDPADALIRLSAGAAMLVVGSRGHSGVVGTMLGSVSARIAAHAACPVLVVHQAAGEAPAARLRTSAAVDALTGGKHAAAPAPEPAGTRA